MAYCDVCGNFDDELKHDRRFDVGKTKNHPDYQPDLYYYWDGDPPLEEDYYWRDDFPLVDCICEICFDIANSEKKSSGKTRTVK